MVALLRPLTYEDLRDMPDDGMRREILRGELVVTPAPTPGHQRVLRNLFRLVDEYMVRSGGGEAFFAPLDVVLGRFDVVQPDLVVLSAGRPRVPSNKQALDQVPDLLVEVLSPSTRRIDSVRKMALYASSGVREYWIADPERRVLTINVLSGEDYVAVVPEPDGCLTSRQLPGLRVDPASIFAGLD